MFRPHSWRRLSVSAPRIGPETPSGAAPSPLQSGGRADGEGHKQVTGYAQCLYPP